MSLSRSLNFSQFVARQYWLWRCASARYFRAIGAKIGGLLQAHAYPYSPTSVNYKV